MKPNSLSIVGDGIVMNKNTVDTHIYSPVLSDHFPVKASFILV